MPPQKLQTEKFERIIKNRKFSSHSVIKNLLYERHTELSKFYEVRKR